MKKSAVIYWSGTGNTEAMANAVLEGMKEGEAEVQLLTPEQVNDAVISEMEALAFGCPAMGAEALEEDEFEPMFSSCKDKLAGKNVALFGSYGWGDGEWMRSWEEDCAQAGISLSCESVTCCEEPNEAILAACRSLGKALVQ